MPRRAASVRLPLLFGIFVIVLLAAFHWAAHPSVASDEDPLRYALQSSSPGFLPVSPSCGPAAAKSASAHVVYIGLVSSKPLASGSHKRVAIKHGPRSKITAQLLSCCMACNYGCCWLPVPC